MNIIFVISAMNGGGAERVIATLANTYVKQGDSVTILMVAGDEVAYPLNKKIQILSIGQPSHGNPMIQIKRLFQMRRYFKEHKGSVIVSFGTEINLFTILASLGLKCRVIVSERNDPNQCRYVWLRNSIYTLGKQFVFQTEDARDCFSERIKNRSRVIPNPIRKELPKPYSGEREKKIVAVGRLEKQKNHELLIRAFELFHKSFPEYSLHIYGDGRLKGTLQERIAVMSLEESVCLEGFQTNILEQIRKAAMYVLSSDYEGISNSLMEAMALGIPCISTNCPIGGSKLCIDNKENGLLIPMGDEIALCEAMRFFAEDSVSAQKMGNNAVGVRETFSEEKIARMWYNYMME